jgi:protein-disulfide isomerase
MADRQLLYDVIQKEIDQYDIHVLPTFFLNGEKHVGVYSEEQLKLLIN